MAKIDLKNRALQVIEMICANETEKILNPHSERTKELLTKIYTYAHVAHGSCENKHLDWKKELNAVYTAMKKDGTL